MKIQVKKDVMDMYSIREFIGKRISMQTNKNNRVESVSLELTAHTNIPDNSKDYIAVYVIDFLKIFKTLKKNKGFFRSSVNYYYKISLNNYYGNYDYNFIVVTQLKPNKKNYMFISRLVRHLFDVEEVNIGFFRNNKGRCVMNYKAPTDERDEMYSLQLKPKTSFWEVQVPLKEALTIILALLLLIPCTLFLAMHETDQVRVKLYKANQQIQELKDQNTNLVNQINQINARLGNMK